MVLAAPGPLLTPLPPPRRPLTGPTPPKLDPRMKRRTPPPNRTCPCRQELDIDDHTDPIRCASRRAPAFINTCHDARFRVSQLQKTEKVFRGIPRQLLSSQRNEGRRDDIHLPRLRGARAPALRGPPPPRCVRICMLQLAPKSA